MDPGRTLALYDALSGYRLTFLYSGLFHDDHTARLITLGDEFLELEGADKGVRGKFTFVMVEAYQNIIRHRAPLSRDLEQGRGRSMFLIRSNVGMHEVTAINPVTRPDAIKLTHALAGMQDMDPGQMKQAYLQGLQDEKRTERGGAGLGLIEMSRRSGHPLRMGLRELDADHMLFALRIMIGRTPKGKSGQEQDLDLQREVVEQGISIVCRGSLAAGEQEVLMRIIERDLDTDLALSNARMRAFLGVTELLQNIAPVGEGPMIVVSRSSNGVALDLCAPVDQTSAEILEAGIREVNAMDDQAKQRRYRDILLGRGQSSGTVQLGLLDLARRRDGPINAGIVDHGGAKFIVLKAMV